MQLAPPTLASSTLNTKVVITVRSRDVESLPLEAAYVPPFYTSAKEIYFQTSAAHASLIAIFQVHGLPFVLSHLVVRIFF